MAGSRPSMQSVQRTLLIGILLGLLFGCIGGLAVGLYYAWVQDPVVYQGGSYPAEMASTYRSDYIKLVVDSYITNRNAEAASQRLQTFAQDEKVRALAERSVAFVANGQGAEAELTVRLAGELKQIENWSDETVKAVVGELANKYQGEPAQAQAVNTFSATLLEGQIPAVSGPDEAPQPPAAEEPPAEQQPETTAPPPAAEEEAIPWLRYALYCVLLLAVIVVIVLLIGRWQFGRSRRVKTTAVEWEGEGPPPIRQWTGRYEFGQDNYDEFFTIETPEGDFLGESGMGILEVVPGTSPKQVVAFDVGLFDKTDITTLSRVVMSQQAFYDENIQAKIQANPQAEAVLAEPGQEFVLETTALRVVATIDELALGGDNAYFERLAVTLDVFLKEGADLRIGSMDVPEQYQ